MKKGSSSLPSSGGLSSKDQLLRVFSKLRVKLLWSLFGFFAALLVGFTLSFWLTFTDKRWKETFDNLKEGDWTFFSLTQQLTKESSNYWLGGLVNFLIFQLLVVFPLFTLWEDLKSMKLLRTLTRQTHGKTEPFELTVFKRKTFLSFYLGVHFFRLLNAAGYSCKVLEKVGQNTKNQKEVLSEEVVVNIEKSSNRRFWVFLLLFALFRILLRWFHHSFIAIIIFVGFYQWNYYVKIILTLVLWTILEVFTLWLFVTALVYLNFWLRAMMVCDTEVVYTSETIHWDKLLKRRLTIPLPINLIFQKKEKKSKRV